MRQQFTFYRSFWEAIKSLPEEDRLKSYDAIAAYALDGEEIPVEGIARSVLILVKPTLDNARIKAESGSVGGTNGLGVPKTKSKKEANEKQTESKTKANEKQTESKIEKEVEIEKENDSSSPYSPPVGDGFERFWKLYPKKVGKEAAKKAFQRARKTASLETLLSAVERQKCGSRWSKDNGRFIPNPATWLNQGRWEDEEMESGPSVTQRSAVTKDDMDRLERYLGRFKEDST